MHAKVWPLKPLGSFYILSHIFSENLEPEDGGTVGCKEHDFLNDCASESCPSAWEQGMVFCFGEFLRFLE